MRQTLVVACAVALGAATQASAQSRTVEQTVKLGPGGTVTLEATKGSVKLIGWDRPEVRISARIEAGSSFEEAGYAERAVAATNVEIRDEGNGVRIRSDYEAVPSREQNAWGNSRTIPEIHYDIRAPRRADLSLNIDRSNSDIQGFEGRVRIESDRSELHVSDIAGDLRIDIDRGGRSRFENVTGGFSLEGDRTDVEVAIAKLTDSAHVELDRGEARIRVNDQQGLTLRTEVERRGSFESDLPLQLSGGDTRSPEGTINGGGPTLMVVAHRAHVRLSSLR